nr:ABC transporter ATP-binding protein [uncultured Blautia sp.]
MNRKIAVDVRDVSMHFNMASENINSLREYLTKLTKKQLFYKDFVAVQKLSFQVKKGEIFGIVGTNGSGKSTLLKMIAGVLTPTTGNIVTHGKIAPLIELGAGFDAELTGRENIYLNGAILGYSQEFLDEHYDEIVDFAEIGEFIDMPLKNYSSGMVSRIAFAIATAVKPDILIADEILSVGDFRFQEKCMNRIQGLMEKGATILLVSHNVDQVRSICNRALWIEKGELKIIGSVDKVCDAYSAN